MSPNNPCSGETAIKNDLETSRPPLKPGIYLEEKKGTIGTGSTAKDARYRSFWATISISPHSAELMLLNDDFKITGIREVFSHDVLKGAGWYYIAEGEKRYQALRPQLDKFVTPAAELEVKPVKKQPAADKNAKPKAAGAKWWEGGQSPNPLQDIFAINKSEKKEQAPPKKGQWWEK